jgi:hypothetical protein
MQLAIYHQDCPAAEGIGGPPQVEDITRFPSQPGLATYRVYRCNACGAEFSAHLGKEGVRDYNRVSG